MALDTKPRPLATHAFIGPAILGEHDGGGGGGRSELLSSSQPRAPRSVGAAPDIEIEGDVTASGATKQMSVDVLVVDDDADVRWTVAEILRSAGLTVAEAEDGEIALERLSSERFRMVLLDLRMPKRDGVSVIEALGEVPPVVVHSAYSIDAAERERLGSRVVDILHKPVSPQKLLRAVETVLGTPG